MHERPQFNIAKKVYMPTMFGLSASAIVHLFFLALFYGFNIWPLFILNITSVAIFLYLIGYLAKTKDLPYTMLLTYIEVIIHQVTAVYLLGWDYGFQFYLLILPGFVLLGSFRYGWLPYLLALLSLFILAGLYIMSLQMVPMYQMASIQEPIYFMNLMVSALILTIISGVFSVNAIKDEKQLISSHNELYQSAITDKLTGLFNRFRGYELLEILHKNFKRNKSSYVLALVDIDDFKAINDHFGHDAGDQVLVDVSKCFLQTFRETDVVCRWGGEEFLLIFPDTSSEQASRALEKVRKVVSEMPVTLGGKPHSITVTIGYIESEPVEHFNNLIKKADIALYKGKHQGKNCVVQG